jgi:hypothetical protein
VALGAKAKKADVPKLGIYNPFEDMAKKVLEPLPFVMLGIFLTRSWFLLDTT